jgi:hypothetical protein
MLRVRLAHPKLSATIFTLTGSPTCPPAMLMSIGVLVPYLVEAHLTVNPPSTSSHANHAESCAEEPGASATFDTDEREMRDLEDILSHLNPMAEEFVTPSLASPLGTGFAAPAPLSPDVYGYYPANVGFTLLCLTSRRFSSFTMMAVALLHRIPSPAAADAATPLAVAARCLLSTTMNSMFPQGTTTSCRPSTPSTPPPSRPRPRHCR